MTISCIITSFDHGRHLAGAIDSVLAQTRPVDEIIIADDCSTDGSREMIEAYARRDDRIRPVLRERNIGVAANRDLAVRAARHPWITTLDGDDLFYPNKMERELAMIENAQEEAVVCSNVILFQGDGLIFRHHDVSYVDGASTDHLVDLFAARRRPLPRDLLLPKRLFEKAGGFDHELPIYEDWDFKLRLAALGVPWRWAGCVGVAYRRDGIGLSSAPAGRHRQVIERILEKNRQQIETWAAHSLRTLRFEALHPFNGPAAWFGRLQQSRRADPSRGADTDPPARLPGGYVVPERKAGAHGASNGPRNPMISVITPCLDRANYAREMVESVRAQRAVDVEHIVVDGGSTDGTLDVLAEYKDVELVSEPDRNLYEALNKGLRRARGDIVVILNSDDYFEPDVFADVAVVFADDETVEMVTGGTTLFVDEGDRRRIVRTTTAPAELELSLYNVLLGSPHMNARFFRRSLLDRIGPFDDRFDIVSDRDFLIRLYLCRPVSRRVNRVVYHYRQHPGSLTFNPGMARRLEYGREYISIAAKFLDRSDIPHDMRRALVFWHSREAAVAFRQALRRGRVRPAIDHYRAAWRRDPWWPLRSIWFAVYGPAPIAATPFSVSGTMLHIAKRTLLDPLAALYSLKTRLSPDR